MTDEGSLAGLAGVPAGHRQGLHVTRGRRPIDIRDASRSWLASVIVIILLAIVFSIFQSRFLSTTNLRNIADQMSVLLVISVAGTFPILIGGIDLSVGSVASLTGVVLSLCIQPGGLGAGAAICIGLLVGVGCGLLNGLLIALARVPSFLVTLGTYFALGGVAAWSVQGTPLPANSASLSKVFDGSLGGVLPILFLWALGVLLLAVLGCRYTRLGRHFYAVGGSELATIIAGVNVRFIKVAAFTLAGVLAGFSGLLLSIHTLTGDPNQGSSLLLPSIGAIVIGGTALSGGTGGPSRTLVGVVLLTVLTNGMQLLAVNPYLQLVVEGAVVVVAVILNSEKTGALSVIK
jgi:ribose/xylose/arabinose/galactoside ABC-type transport system permease subunit